MELIKDWEEYKAKCMKCDICMKEHLLDNHAYPLFRNYPPKSIKILFILEAPNKDDTYNSLKGYLTVDSNTDPSGRLFFKLFTEALRFDIKDLFITNSVLCLPGDNKGKRSVKAKQRLNCSARLKELIDLFNPQIVCTLGVPALLATNLIERHNHLQIGYAVGKPLRWYKRILYPVYHTSLLARNPLNGRPVEQQYKDWKKLRKLCDDLYI